MKSSTQISASLLAVLATFSQSAIATPSSRVMSQNAIDSQYPSSLVVHKAEIASITSLSKDKSALISCPPINTIERKLKKQKSTSSLMVNRVSTNKYWRNAPKGILLDIATVNVSTTAEFELAYSKQIIKHCPGVVAVRFTMYRADLGQAYGLVNGRVKRFECPSGKTVTDHPFNWGYECLP
jgi:hypothetical protein